MMFLQYLIEFRTRGHFHLSIPVLVREHQPSITEVIGDRVFITR